MRFHLSAQLIQYGNPKYNYLIEKDQCSWDLATPLILYLSIIIAVDHQLSNEGKEKPEKSKDLAVKHI